MCGCCVRNRCGHLLSCGRQEINALPDVDTRVKLEIYDDCYVWFFSVSP